MDRYQDLVKTLINKGYLTNTRVINAFKTTSRRNFLPALYKQLESLDSPLPIGQEQSTSQPIVVAIMLELLNPQPGNKVLEIGYGVGWQTVLLSKLVCPNVQVKKETKACGDIYSYEIIEKIAKQGEENIMNNIPDSRKKHIHLYHRDFMFGYGQNAPYDRIISGAAFHKVPIHLIKALKPKGVLVYPSLANDIRRAIRTDDDTYTEEIFPGFVFVPIRHDS